MQVEILPVGLAPDDAIAWFKARVPMTKGEWEQLEERARRRAFTVAGVAQLDLVTDVWAAMARSIAAGETFEQFKAAVGDKLAKAWGGEDPHRLETIYRTNVQMAYQAGRYRQMTEPTVLRLRPYWLFDAVVDGRETEICRVRDQVCRLADDPWWRANYPPLHYRCRSGVRSLTKRQAEARGITVDLPETDPADGFGLAPIPEEWDRGWAKGVQQSANSGKWEPAIIGGPLGPANYGRPALIPEDVMPVAPIAPVKEIGEDEFRKRLHEAWGGPVVTVQDPTGAGVILSDDLLGHALSDGRERFLGLLPDVIANPFEIWLMPFKSTLSGAIAFRTHYIKRYVDERHRNIVFVAEMQKGVWTGYTMFESKQAKSIDKKRAGFLRWGRV